MEILRANEFGKAKLEDILIFETANSIKLPRDYRDFVLKFNGGKPDPNIVPDISLVDWIYVFSGGPDWVDFFHNVKAFENRIPSWYFPFACDPFGNQFLMSLYKDNYGIIAFWNHEGEAPKGQADQYFDNMIFVANSFTDFLSMMVKG